MKPYQSNRSKAYYRHHRNRIICRKKRIISEIVPWPVPHQQFGRLNKGKIHCSCPLCGNKTSTLGIKHSDQMKLDRLDHQLKEL